MTNCLFQRRWMPNGTFHCMWTRRLLPLYVAFCRRQCTQLIPAQQEVTIDRTAAVRRRPIDAVTRVTVDTCPTLQWSVQCQYFWRLLSHWRWRTGVQATVSLPSGLRNGWIQDKACPPVAGSLIFVTPSPHDRRIWFKNKRQFGYYQSLGSRHRHSLVRFG